MRKVPNPTAKTPSTTNRKRIIKILSFVYITHFLELYDFTLCVVMLSYISPLFFPSDSASGSLTFGLLSFSLSSLIHPLASWFWGWYGDKYGRLPMIKRSLMLMALPSFIIAILPTYSDIGIIAPIILIGCRLLQTFSASGEINGSKIFAMEHLGQNNLGKISGSLSCVGGFGVLLAMGMGLLLSDGNISWRVPFFLGSSLAITGVILRHIVADSPEFIKLLKKQNQQILETSNTITMLKQHKNQSIIVMTLAALLGILSYMMQAFLTPYIISLGYSANIAYRMGIIGLIACGVAALITGVIIDRLQNAKRIIKLNIVACIILVPITFILFSINLDNEFYLYIAFIIQGALLGMNACACSVIMYQLFKPENRCRGIMICYSIGMAIFGGFTPLILQLSTKFGNFTPAIIVSIMFCVAYVIYKKNMEKIYDAVP